MKPIAYKKYVDDICKKINDGKTLDVGCLGSYEKSFLIRHRLYKKSSKDIVGIDNNEVFINKANKLGFKIKNLDITDKKESKYFKSKFGSFDHIIATDVLEHIGNMSLALDNMKELLNDKGRIYITVPNIFSPKWWDFQLKNKYEINKDHICWFDVKTLETLLSRSGLEIKKHKKIHHPEDKQHAKNIGIEYKKWMYRRLYAICGKV